MNTRRLAALLCAALAATLLLTGLARAAPALDQQQTTVDPDQWFLVGGSGPQILGQTVTSGVAGLLTQVDLPVACTPGSDLVLQIRDSVATIPGPRCSPLARSRGFRTPRTGSRSRSRLLRSSRTRLPSRSCSPHPGPAERRRGRSTWICIRAAPATSRGRPTRRGSGLRQASSWGSRRTSMRSARCRHSCGVPRPTGPRSRSTAVRLGPSRAPTRGTWRQATSSRRVRSKARACPRRARSTWSSAAGHHRARCRTSGECGSHGRRQP